MSSASFLPDDLYRYRQDIPHAGGVRPLSEGDVFVNIPLVRAARPSQKHAGQWISSIKTGPKALGMLITHPCSSRSRTTHALKESLTVAPVVKCPDGFGPPWEGYYELFPLPALKDGEDFVADLSSLCPVAADHLEGQRIASLTAGGLTALFHRLSLYFTRLDRIPDHFGSESERLFYEVELWELWANVRGTEDEFQEWLDEEFGGQPLEDEAGVQIAGTAEGTGTSRRAVLRWNYEEIRSELEAFLGL
jgi:MoCo/4Fe-4S cofactor protein with predicted Tat translocation signal